MSNTKSMNFKSNFDNDLFSLIQIKKEDFLDALEDYQKRERRFGKIN